MIAKMGIVRKVSYIIGQSRSSNRTTLKFNLRKFCFSCMIFKNSGHLLNPQLLGTRKLTILQQFNSSDILTSLPHSNLWINISSCITAMRDARIFQLRSIDMRKVCTQECLPKDLLGKKSAGEYRIQNDASPEVNQMAQPFIPNLTSNPLVLTQNDTKKNTGGQRTRKNINAHD